MLEPFSLLPLALAGHGGRVDDYEVQQLVAAGLTLLQRSAPLVRALSGRRSAILLPTSPAFVTALAASEGRGAVLVNPLASRYEIAHQLRDANVGAVFTNAVLAAHLPGDVPRVLLDDAPRTAHVVANGTAREVDLGSHHGLSVEGDSDVPGSDDEAAIVYTSAMAGTPLGAILSHRNLLANARSTITAAANSADDRVLALLPFSHLFGLTVTASAPLLAGGTVLTMPRFHPSHVVELIASGAVTEVVGVPAVFRALLTALDRRASSGDALRLCICGGAPLERELQDRWFDATGVELRQGYGLTEASPVCLFNRVDRANARGMLGVPFPNVDVAVGADGEILVRGDNVFRGYVSGGERGLQVRDGWLHTGDRGRGHPDGTIEFAGLLKPMVTRNGFNVYPHEIEQAIRELPGIRGVAVRPGDRGEGEVEIVAEVEGTISVDEVRAWCAQRLSTYKQPTHIAVSASG
jgi:long-chain acyl-CoA synthetase